MPGTVRTMLTAAIIVAVCGAVALAFNAARPAGIPLVRPQSSDQPSGQSSDDGQLLNLARAKAFYDQGAIFLDSRSPEEFAHGTIHGGRNLYYKHAAEQWQRVLGAADFSQPIVCFCDGGGCNSSLILADFLEKQGFEKVYVFEGGWPAWSAAGYPRDGDPATPVPLYH